MGIIQFSMLLIFILVYVVIVGALIARVTARSVGILTKQRDNEPAEFPLQG